MDFFNKIFLRPCFFPVFAILCFATGLYAQIKISKTLNIEDGMIYSQVLSVHEDRRGYMWFGTSSGLSRWDGLTFKNYIFPEGLSDNNCKWIAEFADSTLFFATGKGVIQYKKGAFSKIPGAPESLKSGIHSMRVSADNKLFIATVKSGIWIYDGVSFKNITGANGLRSNNVRALYPDSNGDMYLADGTGHIYVYSAGKLTDVKLTGLPAGLKVSALYRDREGGLWIGTRSNGLFILFAGNILSFTRNEGLPGKVITFISKGDARQVFVSTNGGLAIFENYRLQSILTKENGLSNNFIWQVFRGRNGLFYIGTDGGGVNIYQPGLFQTINTDCGLPDNTVWAICETSRHNFYFGTDEGLAFYDKNGITVFDESTGLSGNMVLALHEGSDGTLYVGTNETGVDRIQNGVIRNINSQQGLDGPSVWTITEDRQGFVYFGTYDGGVNIWNGERVVDTLNVKDGLPTNAVVSSYLCSDGSLYFGTDGGGVFRVNRGRVDSLLLAGNTIWSIYEDDEGNFYFGTNDNGMIYYRHGQWDTLNVLDGLSHNSILGILRDEQGKFYLTADNGLNIVEFLKDRIRIRIIGSRDGLASNECNQGAYYKDSQGYLWFGTVNGVSRYNPALAKPDTIAPKIHFTRFRVYDKDIPIENRNTIREFRYDENYLKFEFVGIDLMAPHKVIYKYRLSGVDEDWVTTTHPNVQYTRLDDNAYTFEVMAGNEWGYWSEPIQLAFVINPPFWETWWFLLIAFLITVSPIIIVIRQRINRLLAVERLRTRIAADLHDDIGTGLSEISILSAVIAARAPAELKSVCQYELNKIGQTARALIDSMSDIVWLVDPRKDTVLDLVSRLSSSFTDIFEAKGIQFRSRNTELLQRIRLDMEYRQHLFMILKEAIHNAVKYSEATEIVLSVSLSGKRLTISVKDNGKGFDVNQKFTGNGLRNMEERAAKIGGQLTLSSKIGEGTLVEFRGTVKK